ncbi:hypothetical protein ACGFZQ_23080 [Streptomyces sp. NPDC048254]|uniref:hypothetical protein n=1 Tax=Streptomyces sp. NPDC048254 TaxID=3365525 RepID=UPI0037136CF6
MAGSVRDRVAGVRAAGGTPAARTVRSGPWLLTGHDGRLIAYAQVDGAVLRWTESRPGGPDWLGPDVLPVKSVTELTVAQGRNRYAHLVGRRARSTGDAPPAVDLVYAIQYQAGRPLSEWRSAGNPHAKRERTAQMGTPAAVVDTSGALHILVATAEGRLALRREDARGRWEPWLDLRVAAVLDTPAAVATATGQVHVLAPTRTGALTWCQPGPGAVPERGADLAVVPLPGSACGLETSPGRITYYLTDAVGGGAVAVRPGSWPVPLGGNPGDGRHAALATTLDGHPCTVLAHRDTEGRLVLGACGAEEEHHGVWWTDTGTVCQGDPVLARDGLGRVVLLALTEDGGLALARQDDGPGLSLGDWSLL